MREREIVRQIKAPNHRHTGVLRGFGNDELTEKIRSRRGLSFATSCYSGARHPGDQSHDIPMSDSKLVGQLVLVPKQALLELLQALNLVSN